MWISYVCVGLSSIQRHQIENRRRNKILKCQKEKKCFSFSESDSSAIPFSKFDVSINACWEVRWRKSLDKMHTQLDEIT